LPLTILLLLAALPAGCGKARPALAGGKPVSHWVEALRDPDARVRKRAVAKLGNVGPGDPSVLPALVGALKDRDPGVRGEAVLAVLKCGPAAGEAVPVLAELERQDPAPEVRSRAARALERLRGPG
jgi:HEAT repeat protein